MRPGMILLGIGLGLLWIAGLYNHATGWLVWLDFVCAILSLGFGLIPDNMIERRIGGGTISTTGTTRTTTTNRVEALLRLPPFFEMVSLLVLWIIALAVGASSWMAWWTFAFAIAYGLLGVGTSLPEGGYRRTTITGPRPA